MRRIIIISVCLLILSNFSFISSVSAEELVVSNLSVTGYGANYFILEWDTNIMTKMKVGYTIDTSCIYNVEELEEKKPVFTRKIFLGYLTGVILITIILTFIGLAINWNLFIVWAYILYFFILFSFFAIFNIFAILDTFVRLIYRTLDRIIPEIEIKE